MINNKSTEFVRILSDFELEASNYHGASLSVYFITSEGPSENRRFEQPNHAIMLWQYYGAIGSEESINRFLEQQPTKFGLTGAKYSAFAVVEGEGTDLFIRMATRAGNLLPDDEPSQSVSPDIKKRFEKIEPGQKPSWVYNSAPAATWIRHLLNFISASKPSRLWGDRLQLDPFATSLAALEQLAGNNRSIEKERLKGTAQGETKVDRIVKRAKNHRFISVLIIVGMIIGGLANFTDAISKIINSFSYLFIDKGKPHINVSLQFPYERSGRVIKQNTRNPELTITNSGHVDISPIIVDANMFVLTPSLDKAVWETKMAYTTHGHSIHSPDLKSGLSVTASLIGIQSWLRPTAYDISIEVFRQKDNKKFTFSSLFIIDKDGIKAAGSHLDNRKADKIRAAIADFLHNPEGKEIMTLTAPIQGVWVPHIEPGVDFKINKDGTATVKTGSQ